MSRSCFIVLLLLTAAAAAFFVVMPFVDFGLARLFYSVPGQFVGRGALGDIGRNIFATVPFLIGVVFLIAWGARRLDAGFARGWRFAPSGRQVAFLAVSLALGPGLLVNLTLKDHMHRPRPVHMIGFGGNMAYRPFYATDGACRKNCAFPSGEAATSFWLVAPALITPPPARSWAIAGAVLFGLATGLLRMAFGGHFLSDVVFGGLLTLLVIGLCWRGIFGWGREANSE